MNANPNNSIATFTDEVAHEIVLSGNDRWEVALCEFSCYPPQVGTIAPHAVFGTTNPMVYRNLICPQFVSSKKALWLRTFIYPTIY